MTKTTILAQLALLGLFGSAQQGKAAVIGLADWCVNLNGNINAACNGAGSGGGASGISLSAFDRTLEPGSNTLGTITLTLGPGNNQFVALYTDYDVDFTTFGAFQDSASVHGALPAGVSYELEDPNTSNIFSDFAGTPSLANVNQVATASGPPNPCCDVSSALMLSGINVLAGVTQTVTFTISATAPTSGFYLQQTNRNTNDSIYVQGIVGGGSVGGVPEPSTQLLMGLGLVGLGLALKRRRSAQSPRTS